MIDREKVIKGLECCSGRIDTECDDCPYNANGNLDVCGTLLAEDALELLKQIEKPKFFVHEDGTIEPLPKIVRCKDCDNRECDGRAGTIVCGITGDSHSRLWFCADGERKEGK